jgi:hypothetical protein
MDSGEVIVALCLLAPILLVSLVWWSCAKGQRHTKRWRRTATLISAIATSASSALMAALLLWASMASIAPAVAHRSLFLWLILLGFGLSIASSAVVVFGTGWLRWVIVPAAVFQCFAWLFLGHIATMPIFPG